MDEDESQMRCSFTLPEGVSGEVIVDAIAWADSSCAQLVGASGNPESPDEIARRLRLVALGVNVWPVGLLHKRIEYRRIARV